jgi:galactose mutarotase-like enzyme
VRSPDQFRPGATVSSAWSYRGFQALLLENEHLRVVVLPGHGARITELFAKAAGRDLLYHHPRFDVRAPVFGANVDDWWTGGIDEVAPTGHPCVVNGEQLPFLGEFWSQAWEWSIEEEGPDRVVVRFECGGIITPIRLVRRLELRAGESFVRSTHQVINVGPEAVPFMWGIHPALAIRPGARIQAPAGEAVFAEGHRELGLDAGARFAWPHVALADGRTLDLSVARAPDPPSWELTYLTQLSGGWLAVTDPATRTGFALAFDPAVLPVVWSWGVYGGWRGVYAVALEAWTSFPARLDEAIAAGRHRTLEPDAVFETELRFIAFSGIGSVGGVDADGRVLEA